MSSSLSLLPLPLLALALALALALRASCNRSTHSDVRLVNAFDLDAVLARRILQIDAVDFLGDGVDLSKRVGQHHLVASNIHPCTHAVGTRARSMHANRAWY